MQRVANVLFFFCFKVQGNVVTCSKAGPEFKNSTCVHPAAAVLFSLAAALDKACPELCGLTHTVCVFLGVRSLGGSAKLSIPYLLLD